MSWKRILTLVGVTAAIAIIAVASTLAATNGGSNTPAQVDEPINGPVVRSDEGIGPNDPSIVHNVEIPDGDSVGVEDSPTLEGPSVRAADEVGIPTPGTPARGSISDLQDVEQLRTLFGQDDGEIRLVLLLSPT